MKITALATGLMMASALLAACNGDLQPQSLQSASATSPQPSTQSLPGADSARVRKDVEFLSADALAGRQTGSAGYQQAADYVAARFKALGLQSITGDDYFQPVPFREASWAGERASLVLHGRDGDVSLKLGEDFIAGPPTTAENTSVTGELVFVGYGIEAPAFGLDDYAGLDLKGKIAVMLDGRPPQLPNEVGAHYSSARTKRKIAAAHGAVGSITLNTPAREARRPFARSAAHLADPSFDWLGADGIPGSAVASMHPSMVLDMPAAKKLFAGSPKTLEAVFAEMDSGETPKGFALSASASLASQSSHKQVMSPNVVGLLPGSDPKLKNEYVVFSAHLDHIGVNEQAHGKDGEGAHDQINNGAQDNAAGIAVMLEVARLFAEAGQAPRRSLLFVAVTAEEEGLLGSDYFAQHPPVAPKAMVANINLDMPMLLYPFHDVIAFGAEHSSLGKTAANAAASTGLKLSPDPMPEQVIFVRSDHYSFVRQGVPSIYLITGREAVDPEINGTEAQEGFLKTRYHRPSDEADAQISYVAAKQFADVNFAIAKEVADAERKPSWNAGDFFGDLYSAQ
ncbi:M28 family metallopeptidase [Microbulbifer pacificus]|uniref:M28 family metallopeptidase n=1 Tax=Microbulbifer pacificus TaxID=407164 RepID=A0AAU0MVP6_9GAMM|nr:M28 family metallopeptidase [Microbulbifer pacificus]WOX03913.1 M28 family metallopeptidase [Microbulbifer pacificus]